MRKTEENSEWQEENEIKLNFFRYFDDCIGFIEKALVIPKNNVLVHCYYGVSRSSTIVIAYLMRKLSISYEKAYEKYVHN